MEVVESYFSRLDYFDTSSSYYSIMFAATTIFFAAFIVWFVGANGFAPPVPQVETLRKSWQELSNNSLKKSWDGLAPPFNHQSKRTADDWQQEQENVTHFCFLVHGHRGLSKVRLLLS